MKTAATLLLRILRNAFFILNAMAALRYIQPFKYKFYLHMLSANQGECMQPYLLATKRQEQHKAHFVTRNTTQSSQIESLSGHMYRSS